MNFPVADWEVIPLEVYKSLLAEVKERFEVVSKETESVTEKTIKFLLGYVTYYFGVGVFLLTNHYKIHWLHYATITLLSAIAVTKGYYVVKLRPSHTAGLLPENVLSPDFESVSDFTDDEKERLYYYNAIRTYVTKIEEGTNDTEKRADKYDSFLRTTLLLISIITAYLIYTIFFHPVSVKS